MYNQPIISNATSLASNILLLNNYVNETQNICMSDISLLPLMVWRCLETIFLNFLSIFVFYDHKIHRDFPSETTQNQLNTTLPIALYKAVVISKFLCYVQPELIRKSHSVQMCGTWWWGTWKLRKGYSRVRVSRRRGGIFGFKWEHLAVDQRRIIMRSCMDCITHQLSFGVSNQKQWDGNGMQKVWKQEVLLQEFRGEPGAKETTWLV